MKSYFRHRPVNEPFEDPSLYVGIVREKRSILFDAGDLHRLSQSEIYKITDIFITHMHIDHFIGFDTIIRSILRRNRPLNVYGPAGIKDAVEGKMCGYTWNLIENYPLRLEVFEIHEGEIRHWSFYAEKRFRPLERDTIKYSDYILKEPNFTVRSVILDHHIPVIAYSLEEELHINIDKALLLRKGLSVGPWLGEFKKAIITGEKDRSFIIENKSFHLNDLMDIGIITKGTKISYVMDVSIDDDNIKKVIELVRNSDYLYCEAYFLHEDIELALKRGHLTGKITGEIARSANVKHLIPMHFSLRYREKARTPYDEAIEVFSCEDDKHDACY